jgi:hypothetical protein
VNGHVAWHEANQQYLLASLALVRETLERHKGLEPSHPGAWALLDAASRALPSPAALQILTENFRLSTFERDLLLLCAGVELDGSFASLVQPYPTFSLALAALPNPHWSALTPDAALRRWRLIELGRGDTLNTTHLRISERVLHFLTGTPSTEERLDGLLDVVPPPQQLSPSHAALASRIVHAISSPSSGYPIIHLTGADGASKRDSAAAAVESLGLALHVLRVLDIPAATADRLALTRLWEREAALTNGALLIDADTGLSHEQHHLLAQFIKSVTGLVFVTSRDPIHVSSKHTTIRFNVDDLEHAEQEMLWREALGQAAANANGSIHRLVAQFNLSPSAIRAASAHALGTLSEDDDFEQTLWDACRAQSRPQLDDLAQRIEPAAAWDDLVLPEAQTAILHQIVAQVRHRHTVYDDWGFSSRGTRGLGISALFAGASGTGKTMAAEVLANALRLDLYRIDLSTVVSKYIGETEKNLRRVFDAAESGGAILLFDEADALFGRRSEVKDSHDRYANIEVSYLLQRMEAYRGLAILTTNMKDALDTAFLRRIRFVVQFPFPIAPHRAEIWRRIFPAQTPTQGLDYEKLSHLSIAGGNIRNIALSAAFLAADAAEPVSMTHLLRAARGEYAKIEKPLTDAEIKGWA